MMRLRCVQTELLLERKSPALTHAERLRVEAHLAECEDCRREHGAMLTLVDLVEQRVESAAKTSVQERAIARALSKARSPEHARELATETGSVGSRLWPRLAWGLALAAAVVLVGFGWSRTFGSGSGSVTEQRELAGDRLKVGTLLAGDQPLKAGDPIPEARELRGAGPFEVSLAHANLKVDKGGVLRWSAKERAVELPGATVEVEVDPSRQQSFRVVTSNFVVDVLGTHFRIALDTVTVQRGRVRVLSRDQKPLAELGAGESWTFQAPVAAVQPAAAASEPAESGQAGVRKPAAPAESSGQSADRGDQLPLPERLARARSRLAGGDARGARADLEIVLAAGGSRALQAEAQMLRADCSLVEGDRSGAVRQYLEVKQRFAGSRVAETALFAAARVESNRGAKAAAKQLLLEYRERYPKGQFRADVDARLKMLE